MPLTLSRINVGSTAGDGTGDNWRAAWQKLNGWASAIEEEFQGLAIEESDPIAMAALTAHSAAADPHTQYLNNARGDTRYQGQIDGKQALHPHLTAISGLTAANGALVLGNGTTFGTLAAGANGKILTMSGGVPTWADNSAALTALAASAWVDTAGSDVTGTLGRIDKPFASIAAAVAAGGRTLRVGRGTFSSPIPATVSDLTIFGAGIQATQISLTYTGVDGSFLALRSNRSCTFTSVTANGADGNDGGESGGAGAVLELFYAVATNVYVNGGNGAAGNSADGEAATDDGMGTPMDGGAGGTGGDGGNGGDGGQVVLNWSKVWGISASGGDGASGGSAFGGSGVNGGNNGGDGTPGATGTDGEDGAGLSSSYSALHDLGIAAPADGAVAVASGGLWTVSAPPNPSYLLSGNGWTSPAGFDPASPGPIGGTTPSTGAFRSWSTGSQANKTLDLSATWNTTGNPALIYGRVTNTASGASSKLLDLGTVADGSLFSVSKIGGVSCVGVRSSDAYLGFYGAGALNLVNDQAQITLGLYNDCTFKRDYAAGTGIVTFCAPYGGTSSLRISGDNGTGAKYLNMHHDGTNAVIAAVGGGSLHISSLPTANPGPGILWNNAGTPAIGT